jgi:hypothetical protein
VAKETVTASWSQAHFDFEPLCGREPAGEILSDSEACRGGVEGSAIRRQKSAFSH